MKRSKERTIRRRDEEEEGQLAYLTQQIKILTNTRLSQTHKNCSIKITHQVANKICKAK
jgi:hypothetical protein